MARYDDPDNPDDDYAGAPWAPPQTTTPRGGPPYTLHNPPPPPPGAPGDLEYRLNPATGQFELHVQGGDDNPAMSGAFGAIGQSLAARPSDNSIPDTPFGGDGGNNYAMGGGSYDGSGFAWPQYNAPRYQGTTPFEAPPAFNYDAFKGPEAFSYEAFKAPDAASVFTDPSYTARRDEGTRAIEHGAAAKGLTRLPATLKSLAGWNQDFASREYGNVFDRAGQTYNTNRGNAFSNYNTNRDNAFSDWGANRNNAADAYSLNYGVSRDVWDRGEKQSLDTFDRNSAASLNEFDYNSWKPASATFDDMYRRWKSELDANTSIASGGFND